MSCRVAGTIWSRSSSSQKRERTRLSAFLRTTPKAARRRDPRHCARTHAPSPERHRPRCRGRRDRGGRVWVAFRSPWDPVRRSPTARAGAKPVARTPERCRLPTNCKEGYGDGPGAAEGSRGRGKDHFEQLGRRLKREALIRSTHERMPTIRTIGTADGEQVSTQVRQERVSSAAKPTQVQLTVLPRHHDPSPPRTPANEPTAPPKRNPQLDLWRRNSVSLHATVRQSRKQAAPPVLRLPYGPDPAVMVARGWEGMVYRRRADDGVHRQ